ncbi:DUF7219 family protein, partial [Nostoc sp. UIC 10890]
MLSSQQPRDGNDHDKIYTSCDISTKLRDFAQKIEYIACLETSGKMETIEAYKQSAAYWQALKSSFSFKRISASNDLLETELF